MLKASIAQLRYTLCFVLNGPNVLMMYRNRPPHQFRWNGLGGKLDFGEYPLDGIMREVREEACVLVTDLYFAGTVTWANVLLSEDNSIREYLPQDGMYVYVARLPESYRPTEVVDRMRGAREGPLNWIPIATMIQPEFAAFTTENLPHFFPMIMNDERPYEYEFLYEDGEIIEVRKRPLTSEEVTECQKSRYAHLGINIF